MGIKKPGSIMLAGSDDRPKNILSVGNTAVPGCVCPGHADNFNVVFCMHPASGGNIILCE